MRRSLTIVLLCCSMFCMAVVPPRDPSRQAEWQAHIDAQREVWMQIQQSGRMQAPAVQKAVGTRVTIPRILVIMANFTDYKILSTKAEVDSMFNGLNWTKDGATGSVRQYFHDQSMGAYNPQFDIVGPVELSKGYADYGKPKTAVNMVKEACQLADDQVDYSPYDSDNDGKVDLVFVLCAGFGENDPPTEDIIPVSSDLIWPQYTHTSAGPFDGKYIYACEYSNELNGLGSTVVNKLVGGIGVVCHEFGHALGLPDMYVTKGSSTHKLLGSWDIMCYGPYNNDMHTPPSFTAYERFFMGWLTPTLITEPDTLYLEPLDTSNKAYLISENDTHNLDGLHPDTAVFYLLENRQLQGWDSYIPGSGLLLTRINYDASVWAGNIVNNDPDNLGVDLIEADGLTPGTNTYYGYYGKAGDAFPAGATSYNGIPDHDITDITVTDGTIAFVYRGGIPADTDSVKTQVVIPAVERPMIYKTVRDGQLLIHSGGHTYSIYGIKQDD